MYQRNPYTQPPTPSTAPMGAQSELFARPMISPVNSAVYLKSAQPLDQRIGPLYAQPQAMPTTHYVPVVQEQKGGAGLLVLLGGLALLAASQR